MATALLCGTAHAPPHAAQNSVRKTHRVIIVEECMRSGGIGASVSSWISENLLEELDHEVIRLSSQDVPTAYAKLLEDGACAAPRRPRARVSLLV